MSQRSNFRRGFFVALVGLSLGLALASGLLALMERFGAREGLQNLAGYSGNENRQGVVLANSSSDIVGDTSSPTRLPGSQEVTAFVGSVAFDDLETIPNGTADELAVRGDLDELAGSRERQAVARSPLFIPGLDGSAGALADASALLPGGNPSALNVEASGANPTSVLDGQELALADDGSDLALLTEGEGAQPSIGTLVMQLESKSAMAAPDQEAGGLARQVADASLSAFRSTATLKALPSGRTMSWVTPGVAMTDQYNPLFLDQRGYCALTFDDGPDRIKDNRIMDILRAEGVPATFFLLGNKLKGAEATIARMLAEGHEIGNHSWSHPQLTKMSYDKAASQVERTSRALEQLGARVTVFRPPYGAQNKRVREIGKDLGMRMLLWDVDSLDWKLRRGVSIRNEIDRTAYRGSVILMHSHVAGTVEALPEIISDLRAKGCTFVTASQWFEGLNGYGQPLPQRTERVANQPRAPKPAASPTPTPSTPSTSYQWNPSPTPVYPSAPTQPADEPIYIY